MKQRLDVKLVSEGIVRSRSQATSYIKLGKVTVNGEVAKKAGLMVGVEDAIRVSVETQYVSRAGLKLESIAKTMGIDFHNKIVLDVGSSTGGFTDFALKNGAKKVIAVDVGTDQMHPLLRGNEKIELHEKTDIRNFKINDNQLKPDLILIDVSFISLRKILPYLYKNLNKKFVQNETLTLAMLKPQFEASPGETSKGVVKNNRIRREIMHDFELWVKKYYLVLKKQDSKISGEKGNVERFYLLSPKR